MCSCFVLDFRLELAEIFNEIPRSYSKNICSVTGYVLCAMNCCKIC